MFPEEDAKECEQLLMGCKHTLAALFVLKHVLSYTEIRVSIFCKFFVHTFVHRFLTGNRHIIRTCLKGNCPVIIAFVAVNIRQFREFLKYPVNMHRCVNN